MKKGISKNRRCKWQFLKKSESNIGIALNLESKNVGVVLMGDESWAPVLAKNEECI